MMKDWWWLGAEKMVVDQMPPLLRERFHRSSSDPGTKGAAYGGRR
jgi:hypothetical protein